jgi:hypothetical protein
MSYTNKCIIYNVSTELAIDEHLAFVDLRTKSCCVPLLEMGNEHWSDTEVQLASDLSQKLGNGVVLLYIECFGGVCDHWARIYEQGKMIHEFVEHQNLDEIMARIGISLAPVGYYTPFKR